jgi:hypothetical protein
MNVAAKSLALLAIKCLLEGRYLLHKLLRRTDENIRHISGIPLIGDIFRVLAVLLGFGDPRLALIAGVGMLMDNGSTLWFLWAVRKDKSFWDEGFDDP